MFNRMLAATALISFMALGCATHEDWDTDPDNGGVYGARQEGNLDATPGRDTKEPYTPVLGDTTGDGLPRDRRTGGGITGTDVTPGERINESDKTRSNDAGGGRGAGGGPPPP